MIPRTSTVCARIPDDVKEGLKLIATHFDMSISDVVVRFSRDGIEKFYGRTTSFSAIYPPEIKKLK